LQVRMYRNCQRDTGLLLLHREHAIFNMLAAHANHIAATLRGIEQQREREPWLRTDWMMRLELLDLVFRPCVESVALDRRELDVCGRIGSQMPALDCELTERAQCYEPRAGGGRGLAIEQRLDPLRWQQRHRPFTIGRTKAF